MSIYTYHTDSIFIYPATLIVRNEPTVIKTILGSCVAVCMWDKVTGYGGMNHYMLPFWNGKGLASPKYGNIAISKLINRMFELGSERSNLESKLFGGGNVLNVSSEGLQVGARNIQIAIDMLNEENINVVAKSLGGNLGRKIQFNTKNGEVLMKYIKKNNVKIN